MFAIEAAVDTVDTLDGVLGIAESAGLRVPAGTRRPGDEECDEECEEEEEEGEVGSLSDEALEEELATHAAQIAAAEGRFCLLADEVDRRGFWYAQGARSCAHWLSWRCSMSTGVAREHLRVGRALRALPAVRRAFLCGELSYSKARAITRAATPEIDERLVDYARYATASQLEDIVRGFRRACPDEAALAEKRHRSRELSSSVDGDGMVVIRLRLAPEEGAVVLAAIEAARQALRQDEQDASEAQEKAEGAGAGAGAGSTGDAPSSWNPAVETGVPAETRAETRCLAGRADALVSICEAALAGDLALPPTSGPRASVIVHVDDQVLSDPEAEGCARAEGVAPLSPHTVQRLLCDARVSTVRYKPDGTVVPEGKTRQIPVGLRRAVLARDHGCRWPGCGRSRRVDVHHVRWVSNGGKTKLTNLATLCRFHHRLVHEGRFAFSMDKRGRVQVVTPDGADLSRRAVPAPVRLGDLAERNVRAGLDLHSHTMPTGGEPYDLDLTIDVLLADLSVPVASGAS